MQTIIQVIDNIDHDQGWANLQAQQLAHDSQSPDQIWIMNIAACYSAGNDLRNQHVPDVINGLPVYRSRRGGAMTHYTAGQLHLAMIIDLGRLGLDVADFNQHVMAAAAAVLQTRFNFQAQINLDDVGIYDQTNAKIGSLGFIFKNGVVVGGLSLNICADLSGFDYIDVCGAQRCMANVLAGKLSWTALAAVGQDIALQLDQRLHGAT